MRSRTPVLLVAATALLGLAWAMLVSGGEDVEPQPSPAEASGQIPTPSLLEGVQAAPGEASSRAQDTGRRERLQAEGCVLLRVRVEEKVSGESLPGARVCYLDSADLEAFLEHGLDSGMVVDLEAVAERHGQTVIADAQGLVSVPVRRSVRISGRSGELYGEATLSRDPDQLPEQPDRQHPLRLERDLTLRIKVLDHDGAPAVDMPVEVLPVSAASRARTDDMVGVRTGDQGTAWIPHWQVLVRERRWIRGLVDRTAVRGAMPGVASESATFDPAEPPAEVQLRLPPAGRITVRAFDDAGPVANYHLTLQVVPDGEEHDNEVPEVLGTREWTVPVSKAEPATFEHVVLGRRFRAQFRQDALKAAAVFSGPQHPGQEVSVALHAVVESSVLVGRAVDQDLDPIGNASLRFSYATEGGAGTRLVATDAAGRFRINLGHASAQRTLTKGEISLVEGGTTSPASPGLIHLIAPRSLLPGDEDLGDVVLGEAALLAAGHLQESLENGTASDGTVDIAVERAHWRGGEPRWERDPIATVGFPAPGFFEVWGVARSGRYRLRVQGPRHLPVEPMEFTPGARDLEIPLLRGGALRATLLVEEEVGDDDLVIEIRPLTPPVAGPMTLAMARDRLRARAERSDGELRCYRWEGLWPAAYAVEVKARSGRVPLSTVPVQITAGEQTILKDIDLRERLRVVRLQVLGPGGQVIPDGHRNLVLVDSGNGSKNPKTEPRCLEIRDGLARIVTGSRFTDVVVVADGFLPKRVRGFPGDNTVLLEKVPRVTVSIRSGLSSLPESHAMDVRLVARGTNLFRGGGVSPEKVRVDAAGNVSVPVANDGWYRVMVYVSRGDQSVRIGRVEPGEVRIAEPKTATPINVRVPLDALREALAALAD